MKYYKYNVSKDEAEEHENLFKELLEEYDSNGGFIYVEINSGYRKGSIAKLVSKNEPTYSFSKCWRGEVRYDSSITYRGTLKLDGRKNKPKSYLGECTWLKGYQGETIWKQESIDDIKRSALEKPLFDIKNNQINIGDRVLYINTRYGGGSKLCFGTIDRFEVEFHKYNSSTTVYTIVRLENEDQESKIQTPNEYIYKISDCEEV